MTLFRAAILFSPFLFTSKTAGAIMLQDGTNPEQVPLGDRKNMAYSGESSAILRLESYAYNYIFF
jgi:hypothetical protein